MSRSDRGLRALVVVAVVGGFLAAVLPRRAE